MNEEAKWVLRDGEVGSALTRRDCDTYINGTAWSNEQLVGQSGQQTNTVGPIYGRSLEVSQIHRELNGAEQGWGGGI